ncbi:MAG: hypothetical protein DRI44_01900 [Chlamydiae bacterium]|nr:MAG: hypothetical protein DRI44_01900 [Chlamydiota bacterium]
MKKLILIINCLLLSTVFVKANFVLHSYAGNTALTKNELKQSKKSTKKIIDSLQYNPCNKDDMYTIYIPLNIREVFEKSVARQLKGKNKLNAFSSVNTNDKKSIDNFTKENIGVFINAFIEAVDYCIPTNKYTGLKDRTQCETEDKWQIGRFKYIAHKLRNKYPKECWNYVKPRFFSYNTNNFNNPAYYTIFASVMDLTLLTNKLTNDEQFFKEFRKYDRLYRNANINFGTTRPLDEVYKKKSTVELGLLLEEDWKHKWSDPYDLDTHYIDHGVLNAVYAKKTEEAYQVYEKFEKRRMASWNSKRSNYRDCIVGCKEHLKDFKKMSLNSESKIKLYFAQLKNAQELAEKYPESRLYFHTGDCTRKIVKEAKPRFKEVYWQYMNGKQEDNQENKLAQIIAGTAGAAFGKVMTEEDLPRAFDYVNKQRSFKLIDLLSFYKKTPPLAHKSASISMLLELSRNNRTNMVVYFIKRYKKIKDPQLRRGFLEMAPEFGLTNYPKPFYP